MGILILRHSVLLSKAEQSRVELMHSVQLREVEEERKDLIVL